MKHIKKYLRKIGSAISQLWKEATQVGKDYLWPILIGVNIAFLIAGGMYFFPSFTTGVITGISLVIVTFAVIIFWYGADEPSLSENEKDDLE